MDLSGKTAIVTGAGRDIGAACAMRLARAGANVVLNYHKSADGAETAVRLIRDAGGKAIARAGDMTDPDAVKALVDAAVAEFGSVDIVINNTGGILARKTIPEMTLEHWNAVMAVNVTSTLLLVQAALPHLGEGGAIVNLASQAGRDGAGPGAIAYGAAKGAVMTMTRGMAKELGPKIRVNALCPGMIDTDFHNIHTKDAVRSHVANASPVKREGTPEDVAELICFLSTPGAYGVTGNTIRVCGQSLIGA